MKSRLSQVAMKMSCWVLGTLAAVYIGACVPPAPEAGEGAGDEARAAREAKEIKCLRLLSSAAEYYKNKDWQSTVRVYEELVDLGCDKGSAEEVFQYWAVAYEYMGKFDSSEYVLLQGLKRLPDNLNLHERLAYSYRRLSNTEKEIYEVERITELSPEDTEPMKRLSELYGEVGRYGDQIYILEKILALEPDNKDAQGDLGRAFEKTGKDPLDIYRRRFADNPGNLSFGLDLADQVVATGDYDEAIAVLEKLRTSTAGNGSVSTKLILKKLSKAYDKTGRLQDASKTYEDLFELDPRDFRAALDIVTVNIELLNFGKATAWADRAIKIAPENGETYGQKGLVYYRAFQECRKDYPVNDDRIVASLAHQYFRKSEQLNYQRFRRDREYLEDNKDDLMFGRANWFMLDDEQKMKGSISPSGSCYDWVKESIQKDPSWD